MSDDNNSSNGSNGSNNNGADNNNTILNNVNRVVDIVNQAVATKDYTSMSRQIGDLIGAPKADDLYRDVRERFSGNKYHAGHMSTGPNATSSSASGMYAKAGQESKAQAGPGNSSYMGSKTYVHPDPQYKKPGTGDVSRVANAIQNPWYASPKSMPGKLMLGGGIAGAVIMFIPTIILFGTFLLTRQNPLVGAITSIPFILLLGFGVLAVFGGVKQAQVGRFEKYKAVLGSKMYADVKTLASAVGYSEKKTVKDLSKMITYGWFRQGHFDTTKKTFMATDALYQQSQSAEQYSETVQKAKDAQSAEDRALTPEVRKLLDRGNAYIAKIKETNDAIPDTGVSEKLDRMEKIVTKIFAQVKVQPSLVGKLNMFMDYYLPTTGKLMDAYREMDAQPIQGKNIVSAKKEIEDSLDTINDAFESLLDSFFQDKAMDVSTDISVMKTMMKQQGLTPGDLEAMKMKNAQPSMEQGPTLSELQKQIDEQKQKEAETVETPKSSSDH